VSSDTVRIIPLGGVGEMGKNCILVETDEDAILVDLGLMFPDEEMLGVDLVIPDISYVRDHADRLRAVFITHGHEDHIGALPYLLGDILGVPIYATRLTHGLISARLKEHRLLDVADLRIFAPGETIRAGVFSVTPYAVTHSIPDAVGLAIDTPVGLIVHSGDFKFDPTPIFGEPIDREVLAALGRRGVLVLLSDCVRVEKLGHTPSERVVGEAFDALVRGCAGRVIIATFASNISRVRQAIDVAGRYGRKAALVGRSMANNVRVATDLGYFESDGTLVRVDVARRLPPQEVLLVTTGSQGEPSAALSRIANSDHRQIQIIPGDTVIISATPIPGNEETVAHTIDNLMRLGAEVIYEPLASVHVSGHASQDELRLLVDLLHPRYCVPIHGEFRHMVLYRKLCGRAGVPIERVPLIDVGDVLELSRDGVRVAGQVPVSSVLVDGVTVGGTTDVVLRDRRHLARDGVVIAVLAVDRMTGELLSGPEIVARGIVELPNGEAVFAAAQERVRKVLERSMSAETEYGFLVQKVRETLGEFIYQQLHSHPMILPVITEV
jgi:ribonuclease J